MEPLPYMTSSFISIKTPRNIYLSELFWCVTYSELMLRGALFNYRGGGGGQEVCVRTGRHIYSLSVCITLFISHSASIKLFISVRIFLSVYKVPKLGLSIDAGVEKTSEARFQKFKRRKARHFLFIKYSLTTGPSDNYLFHDNSVSKYLYKNRLPPLLLDIEWCPPYYTSSVVGIDSCVRKLVLSHHLLKVAWAKSADYTGKTKNWGNFT